MTATVMENRLSANSGQPCVDGACVARGAWGFDDLVGATTRSAVQWVGPRQGDQSLGNVRIERFDPPSERLVAQQVVDSLNADAT